MMFKLSADFSLFSLLVHDIKCPSFCRRISKIMSKASVPLVV
jgi:hypothetical protein